MEYCEAYLSLWISLAFGFCSREKKVVDIHVTKNDKKEGLQ